MSNSFVIAESGGSKTDWALVVDGGIVERRTTGSLHPVELKKEAFSLEKEWIDYDHWRSYPLYFFGAGCFRDEGKEVLSRFLQTIFDVCKVYSDLDAAGIAAYGEGQGWFAILGTGSVLADWNRKKIEELRGGLGYELGDEGSGYYFGKLVLQSAIGGDLTQAQLEEFNQVYSAEFPDFDDPATVDRSVIAELPKLLSGSKLFDDFHERNLRLFFEKYVKEVHVSSLAVVGSYGHFQRTLLSKVAVEFDVEISVVIERPIDHLIERKGRFVD